MEFLAALRKISKRSEQALKLPNRHLTEDLGEAVPETEAICNIRITLSFLSLLFWNSLHFSSSRNSFPYFSGVLPFFSRDFRGSVGIKKSLFSWWFSLPFPPKKKTRKGRTGYIT